MGGKCKGGAAVPIKAEVKHLHRHTDSPGVRRALSDLEVPEWSGGRRRWPAVSVLAKVRQLQRQLHHCLGSAGAGALLRLVACCLCSGGSEAVCIQAAVTWWYPEEAEGGQRGTAVHLFLGEREAVCMQAAEPDGCRGSTRRVKRGFHHRFGKVEAVRVGAAAPGRT